MKHSPLSSPTPVAARLVTAATLIASLRLHDVRAAVNFTRVRWPAHSWPIRIARFIAWTARQILAEIPTATTGLSFARPVSRTPIWLAGGNPLANHPWNKNGASDAGGEAAVLVIGAGFTGAGLAYHWAKAPGSNGRMVVVEMADPACGASGRNEGLVVMGRYYAMVCDTVARHLKDVRRDLNEAARKQLARQFADAYCRAAYKNAELVETTIRCEKFNCDYVRRGWVQVRGCNEQADLDASVAMAAAAGFGDWTKIQPMEVMTRTGMRVASPTGFSPGAASFHPAKWVWELLRSALDSGSVELFTRTKVLAIDRDQDGYLVRTTRGMFRASRVVTAVESQSALLHASLRRAVWPVQSQAAFGVGGPVFEKGVGISGPLFFCVRQRDGLTFGSDATRVPLHQVGSNVPSRFLTYFAAAELARYGGAFPLRVEHEWSGTVGYTPDEYPIVGPIDGGRHYIIAGMCGSGTAVSFNAARHVVQHMLGLPGPDDYPEAYFSPRRLTDPTNHVWPQVHSDDRTLESRPPARPAKVNCSS